MFLIRILGILFLLVMLYWGLQRFAKRHALTMGQFKWLLGIGVLLAVVLVMVALGRIPIQALGAPVMLALTFALRNVHLLIRLFPMLRGLNRRIGGGRGAAAGGRASGDVSTIRTRFLAMELQHNTGAMDGEVLQGRLAGQRVSALSVEQLLELADECRTDNESLQVLEAYLDREHPQWREASEAGTGNAAGSGSAGDEWDMTESLALEILGLQPGASEEEITAAHRKLMQKMHPDRGGSDYLARKVNQARDFLTNR